MSFLRTATLSLTLLFLSLTIALGIWAGHYTLNYQAAEANRIFFLLLISVALTISTAVVFGALSLHGEEEGADHGLRTEIYPERFPKEAGESKERVA